MPKERIVCQNCSADYYINWLDDREDEYDDELIPNYCPFCGAENIELEDVWDEE